MPMPPPKPITDGPGDPHLRHEVGQITRALAAAGPMTPEALAEAVGAAYWEKHRFERALTHATTNGVVVKGSDGQLQIT